MNIYLIQEDGEAKCWQAATMSDALEQAQDAYFDELDDPPSSHMDPRRLQDELLHYQSDILQSCTLVGELANP